MTKPEFDEIDAKILAEYIAKRDAIPGPRIGDYVEFADGKARRIGIRMGDGFQLENAEFGSSFALNGAHMSFSGGLAYPAVPAASLCDTGKLRDGGCWMFHHGKWEAHNGVDTVAPCRVFKVTT